MDNIREIRKSVTGNRTVDGGGVNLVRVIGKPDTQDFDPFLMLDAFDSVDPADYTKGFPWHPHRGIETITYLIKGDIEHEDSLGNKGSILDGQCQWMTAGSGIIHQEMPKASPRMLGVQLWLNLPAKDKMVAPQYHGITAADIPVVTEDGQTIRIIAGKYKGQAGARQGDYVKPLILDVEVNPAAEWTVATDPEATVFAYIIEGEGEFGPANGRIVPAKHALLFAAGSTFRVKASAQGVRFLLMAGQPLKEPIAWGGPIVMNTKAELSRAFEEIENNTFIR